MSIVEWIGTTSLNLSFILYLLVYLPQILHNRSMQHALNLSLWMHYILYASYSLDLIYGFSSHLQWQYKTVSIVGLSLLMIQHIQIMYHRYAKKTDVLLCVQFVFLLITGLFTAYFFIFKKIEISERTTQIIGYLSRAGFLFYTLPQIFKNRVIQSAQAISIQFIYLSLMLSILDMASAWCLNWGWPNKLGSPLTICLMCIMLYQMKKYNSQTDALHPNAKCNHTTDGIEK